MRNKLILAILPLCLMALSIKAQTALQNQIDNNPSLRNIVITDLPANIRGLAVRFKLQVTNIGGYIGTSLEYLSVIVSDVPDTPTQGPKSDASFTNYT